MTTRIRALYTDADCIPYALESDTLWASQTKSLALPVDAQHIKVSIDKEVFIGSWVTVYNATLTGGNKCLRITGVTMSSTIKECE